MCPSECVKILTMKQLFLTSSISFVARDIAKHVKTKGLKLAFIKTGSEVEKSDPWWLKDDRRALEDVGFKVADYTVTNKTVGEIEKDMSNFDAIFVSGGNTFYLLEKFQVSGALKIIRDFVDSGKIYLSSSAGSLVAGPDISTARGFDDENAAPNLKGRQGLGLVDFIVIPHWGAADFKEEFLGQKQMESLYNNTGKLVFLNNNQYIKVEGDMYQIISVNNPSI